MSETAWEKFRNAEMDRLDEVKRRYGEGDIFLLEMARIVERMRQFKERKIWKAP